MSADRLRFANGKLALACTWLVALLSAASADAQRTLHWDALDVSAQLDSDGRLHVVERHALVFDGEWNGGERRFRLQPRQTFELIAVRRIDAGGAKVPLVAADLTRVDEYAFTDRTTLRWRSRTPSDPPFRSTRLVYEIEYELGNILRRDGDAYWLDHDFAFPDRAVPIGQFSLTLTFDSAWMPAADAASPVTLQRANLPPGESVVVTLPLRYATGGAPAGVRAPASPLWLFVPLVVLFPFVTWRLKLYLAHEERNGRFAPLPAVAAIDDAWLAEHVLKHPPEKVGNLWDNRTGEAEVAAILARLVQQGRLISRIETRRRVLHEEAVLHLRIPSPRPEFNAYESALIDALFVDGDATDTARVREYYRKRGAAFDPAAILRRWLPHHDRVTEENRLALAGGWKLSLALAMAAAVAFGASVVLEARSGISNAFVLLSILIGFAAAAFGAALIVLGFTLRDNVVSPRTHLLSLLGVYAAYVLVSLLVLRGADAYWPSYLVVAALAALIFNLMLQCAYTRVGANRIKQRKLLSAARSYFAEQLARPQPRLRDDWYPYLIAFGLDKQMDRWFRAFGPVTHAMSGSQDGSPTAHGGVQSPSAWTGGGGTFGGAGASGAWSGAAGAMAAGVAVASSSSNGSSSGGGGGSSGGGGGGGW
jgi:uncharacterized membrane protein YgcG